MGYDIIWLFSPPLFIIAIVADLLESLFQPFMSPTTSNATGHLDDGASSTLGIEYIRHRASAVAVLSNFRHVLIEYTPSPLLIVFLFLLLLLFPFFLSFVLLSSPMPLAPDGKPRAFLKFVDTIFSRAVQYRILPFTFFSFLWSQQTMYPPTQMVFPHTEMMHLYEMIKRIHSHAWTAP